MSRKGVATRGPALVLDARGVGQLDRAVGRHADRKLHRERILLFVLVRELDDLPVAVNVLDDLDRDRLVLPVSHLNLVGVLRDTAGEPAVFGLQIC